MSDTATQAAPAKRPYQRKLRNYLLDAGYQLRFTLVIVGISAVLTGGLGAFVMRKAQETSRVVNLQALDDEAAKMVAQQFADSDRVLMFGLIGFGLLLSVVLAGYGIVLTHKVAGPLFKVTLYLDKIRDGKLGVVYNLRKGDQLVDFFEHFKGAHDSLRKRTEEDIVLLDRAIAELGASPLAAELRDVKARKEESLK